jgi:dihydrofolate reductase
MVISILVAIADNNVIGKDNKLVWNLPADLRLFKNLTMGHTIVMGRKTFDSIGKPLPGRKSIIITRQKDYKVEGCVVVNSLEEAMQKIENEDEVFIIGGAQIFELAMELADRVYLTKIDNAFEGDTFFPEIHSDQWVLTKNESFLPDEKNVYSYTFKIYNRKINPNA